MYDTIIRGGLIADGTGRAPFAGDVAICDGIIVEIGHVSAPAKHQIDADGAVVTPGFVDIHTHFDGQATWDSELAPSLWHGVTTAIQGNCGVGFAPVRQDARNELIDQMEGVEDIPGTALHAGMRWEWETFPEYLDTLDRMRYSMDVGTQVPHAAVRHYVMRDRSREPNATPEEIQQMADIVADGLEAGALGFSTSRMLAHMSLAGDSIPGTFAAIDELEGIARRMQALGKGVFQIVPRGMDGEISVDAHAEVDWMARLAQEIGRPMLFSVVQTMQEKDRWRVYLDKARELVAKGIAFHPLVSNRTTGTITSLQSDQHLFSTRPAYGAIAHLPVGERAKAMREPGLREKILSEEGPDWTHPLAKLVFRGFERLRPVRSDFNVEPGDDQTISAIANSKGVSAEEVIYDLMSEDNGKNMLLFPFTNYENGSLDDVYEMLTNEASVFGLSDAGAHCGVAVDASNPTVMLCHWVRDRTRGPRIPLETAVKWMTNDTANVYGLGDRGRISIGYKADLNVIDLDRLHLKLPEMIFDLPAGGRRLTQRASGYLATIQSGEVTIRHDEFTGALPGRLIRGSRTAPTHVR